MAKLRDLSGQELIPGYRFVRRLGEGSFGEVWESTSPGGTKKALKIVDLSASTNGLREYRGIERVKHITHANLLETQAIWLLDKEGRILSEDEIALFETPTGSMADTLTAEQLLSEPALLIVAMSLCEGNLQDRLKECFDETGQGIPVNELLSYMEQAARGIDHLNKPIHDLGEGPVAIQHCDIKPENMMLSGDSVLVGDFGIAKVLGDQYKQTQFIGTLYYLSPEMIEDKTPSVSTDQYSLACSYFRLRTGRLPFRSETSVRDIVNSHCTGKLDLHRIEGNRERAVIRRATSLDPAKRFSSNRAMVEALRNAIEEDSRPKEPVWKRVARAALQLAAVLVIGTVCAAVYFGWLAPITNGNGGSAKTNGGEKTANFKSRSADDRIEINFAKGQWEQALDSCESLRGEFPQEAASLQKEFIVQLLNMADGNLDQDASTAIRQYEIVRNHTGEGEKSWCLAVLGVARGHSRNDQWVDVGLQLDTLETHQNGAHLSDANRAATRGLRVLQLSGAKRDTFFQEPVLDSYVALIDEGLSASQPAWESQRLTKLRLDSAILLVTSPEIHDQDDGRLDKIFGQDLLACARAIGRAKQAIAAYLQDRTVPDQLPEIRRELEETHVNDQKMQGFAEAYRLILAICDPAVPLQESCDQLDQQLYERDTTSAVLMTRLENDVLSASLPDSVMAIAGDFVTREELPRNSAVQVANSIHQIPFDYPGALSQCEQVRDEFAGRLRPLVDAIWAECKIHLAKERRRFSGRQEVFDLLEVLSEAKLGGIADDYLDYVCSRIAYVKQNHQRAKEAADFLLRSGSDKAPAFFDEENRRDHSIKVLIEAAQQLRVKDDNQILSAAYDPDNARTALSYLGPARTRFKATEDEFRRQVVVGMFCVANPDYPQTLTIFPRIKLSPEKRTDGLPLWIKAKCLIEVGASQDQQLNGLADVLRWWNKFSHRDRPTVYERIVEPALAVASGYESLLGDPLAERDQPLDVSRILPAVRADLASVYATSAAMLDQDFDIEQRASGGDNTAAAKLRYAHFRLANTLGSLQADYCVKQANALYDWYESAGTMNFRIMVHELETLSIRALEVDSSHAQASCLRGQSILWLSRTAAESQKLEMLAESIRLISLGLPRLEKATKARFLTQRSAAQLESAFWVAPRVRTTQLSAEEKRFKREYLAEALSDAKQAVQVEYRRNPDWALIAWAHAAEDIAWYIGDNAEASFDEAISKLREAAERALDPYAALMAQGRCYYRKSKTLEEQGKGFTPELDNAIRVLGRVIEEAKNPRTLAEAYSFLSASHYLANDTQAADNTMRRAAEVAGQHQWFQIQSAWIRRAATQSSREKRVQRVIDEKQRGDKIVSWTDVYTSLTFLLAKSSVGERKALIDRYLNAFPSENPDALPYRVQWLLWYARSFNKDKSSEPELRSHSEYAEQAHHLASQHGLKELQHHSSLTAGRLTLELWKKKPKEKLLLSRSASKLIAALEALDGRRPPSLSKEELFQCYIDLTSAVLNLDQKPPIEKAIVLLNEYQKRPELPKEFRNGVKDALIPRLQTRLKQPG